jgi:hypothetical protein
MQANLYISCPNILASMHAQKKLRDTFGFQILTGKEQNPHFSDRFVVVTPPPQYAKDKPVICYSPPTYDHDMNETWEKDHEWIDMFDALKLISLVTPRV